MTLPDRCRTLQAEFAAGRAPLDAVDAAIDEFYAMDGNESGGHLHIVLDDSNLEDDSIEWCIEQARKANDADAVALGELLRAMTLRQRLEVPACTCPCGCTNALREQVGLLPIEPSVVAEDLPGGGVLIRSVEFDAPAAAQPRFEVAEVRDGVIALKRKDMP